ncbi:SUN-domain-containing protein [Sodiomyces alkalinus F11]|uniref:SUN-domain-containing protein n=1 Tax=Sodiomyces alkalinus (strain CBS 110278 / VKM F-3762 / F11) TaxID=1314773 RepID=A0A3N2PZ65_SODAK|nr:SUN-domain-containing protein [Sodiomyces alkalinus F11]ROT39787.1 SUN-domain-containing protein [Sodiomyces alkalinus F11]
MMKSITHLALAASLIAGVAAHQQQQQHQHQRLHKKHVASPVEKREPDAVTVYEAGPTVTHYVLAGERLSEDEAKEGIADGLLVVVGESTPSFSPPPPPASSSEPATSTRAMAAQFFESKEASSSTPAPSPTPTPSPTTSSEAPAEPTSSAPANGGGSGSGSGGGTGLDAEFPSGEVKCSHLPTDYGVEPLDWLDIGGWAGIQKVPRYRPGHASIDYIETAVDGGCEPGAFCSYACPVGYQKTQWPEAQGATLQSIGGLWCNDDGFLELTRPEKETLCEAGAGGVWIQNDLDDIAAVCQTDYPGHEAMVIPTIPKPGEKLPLTNPYAPDYYVWNDLPTSGQFYVNKKGYKVEDACVWDSAIDPEGAGNWAPINIGSGMAADGNTYISIFPNAPTSIAKLDFNIEIIGDVNSKCALINGVYTGGSTTGCTTTLPKGAGEAIIRFFK